MLWCQVSGAEAYHLALFRCAKELSEIHREDDRALLFTNSDMAFASVRVGRGSSPTLVVLNEVGIYGFRIQTAQRVHLRMSLPDVDPRVKAHDYFLSYSHSDVFGNRFSNMGRDLVPEGRAPSDFREAESAKLSEAQLLDALLNVISYELDRLGEMTRSGRITRTELLNGNLSMCRVIQNRNWAIARQIDRQVKQLELVSVPQGGARREPASLR